MKEKVWTIDKVRAFLPQERREHYETQHKNKIGDIYTQVADLLNLVEEKGVEVNSQISQVLFCALRREQTNIWCYFFGPPRFAVWIPKKEAERLSDHCEFERYDDQHRHAVYPTYTLVDELLPILESVYLQVEKLALSESRGLEYVAARARLALFDMGRTPEEIDALLSKASS